MEGRKYDSDKLRWDLLPLQPIEEIIRVLMFGAEKYDDHNWQKVDNGRNRYYNATMRHLTSWFNGERLDPESGIHHLAHAGCCIVFLLWIELNPLIGRKENS